MFFVYFKWKIRTYFISHFFTENRVFFLLISVYFQNTLSRPKGLKFMKRILMFSPPLFCAQFFLLYHKRQNLSSKNNIGYAPYVFLPCHLYLLIHWQIIFCVFFVCRICKFPIKLWPRASAGEIFYFLYCIAI